MFKSDKQSVEEGYINGWGPGHDTPQKRLSTAPMYASRSKPRKSLRSSQNHRAALKSRGQRSPLGRTRKLRPKTTPYGTRRGSPLKQPSLQGFARGQSESKYEWRSPDFPIRNLRPKTSGKPRGFKPREESSRPGTTSQFAKRRPIKLRVFDDDDDFEGRLIRLPERYAYKEKDQTSYKRTERKIEYWQGRAEPLILANMLARSELPVSFKLYDPEYRKFEGFEDLAQMPSFQQIWTDRMEEMETQGNSLHPALGKFITMLPKQKVSQLNWYVQQLKRPEPPDPVVSEDMSEAEKQIAIAILARKKAIQYKTPFYSTGALNTPQESHRSSTSSVVHPTSSAAKSSYSSLTIQTSPSPNLSPEIRMLPDSPTSLSPSSPVSLAFFSPQSQKSKARFELGDQDRAFHSATKLRSMAPKTSSTHLNKSGSYKQLSHSRSTPARLYAIGASASPTAKWGQLKYPKLTTVTESNSEIRALLVGADADDDTLRNIVRSVSPKRRRNKKKKNKRNSSPKGAVDESDVPAWKQMKSDEDDEDDESDVEAGAVPKDKPWSLNRGASLKKPWSTKKHRSKRHVSIVERFERYINPARRWERSKEERLADRKRKEESLAADRDSKMRALEAKRQFKAKRLTKNWQKGGMKVATNEQRSQEKLMRERQRLFEIRLPGEPIVIEEELPGYEKVKAPRMRLLNLAKKHLSLDGISKLLTKNLKKGNLVKTTNSPMRIGNVMFIGYCPLFGDGMWAGLFLESSHREKMALICFDEPAGEDDDPYSKLRKKAPIVPIKTTAMVREEERRKALEQQRKRELRKKAFAEEQAKKIKEAKERRIKSALNQTAADDVAGADGRQPEEVNDSKDVTDSAVVGDGEIEEVELDAKQILEDEKELVRAYRRKKKKNTKIDPDEYIYTMRQTMLPLFGMEQCLPSRCLFIRVDFLDKMKEDKKFKDRMKLLAAEAHSAYLKIDEIATSIPAKANKSLKTVLSYLIVQNRMVVNEEMKQLRAMFRWVCHHCVYQDEASDDPEEILKTRRCSQQGFAILFHRLCEMTDFEVMTISGYYKLRQYYPGMKFHAEHSRRHYWNAVRVNNRWSLYDCFSSNYLCIGDSKVLQKFNEGYFDVPPELFKYTHFPLELIKGKANVETVEDFKYHPKKMQFEEIFVTLDQFQDSAYVGRALMQFQMDLLPDIHTLKIKEPLHITDISGPPFLVYSAKLEGLNSYLADFDLSNCTHCSCARNGQRIFACFPLAGRYSLTITCKPRFQELNYMEKVVEYIIHTECGVYDVYPRRYSVMLGFLQRPILGGRDEQNEILSQFSLYEPTGGYVRVHHSFQLAIGAPQQVQEMIVSANGRWIRLQPKGEATSMEGSQLWEASVPVRNNHTDIVVYYRIGTHWHICYQYTPVAVNDAEGVLIPISNHRKLILDNDGRCFRGEMRLVQRKSILGKSQAHLHITTLDDCEILAVLKRGWDQSATLVNSSSNTTVVSKNGTMIDEKHGGISLQVWKVEINFPVGTGRFQVQILLKGDEHDEALKRFAMCFLIDLEEVPAEEEDTKDLDEFLSSGEEESDDDDQDYHALYLKMVEEEEEQQRREALAAEKIKKMFSGKGGFSFGSIAMDMSIAAKSRKAMQKAMGLDDEDIIVDIERHEDPATRAAVKAGMLWKSQG